MKKFSGYLRFIIVFTLFVFASSLQAGEEEDRYNRAMGYWGQNNWTAAITEFESFISAYPNSPARNDAELRLGDSYMKRANYANIADLATARTHFDFIIKQGKAAKNFKDASLQNAFTYYCSSDYQAAKPLLDQYVSNFPNDDSLAFAYYYLGMCELHLGNYQQAINLFDSDLNKFPNGALKAECQLDRAVAVGKSGNYAQADQQLTALASNPSYKYNLKAALQRANLKIDQRLYADAIAVLEPFIIQNQNNPNAKSELAEAWQYEVLCYNESGQYDKALATAETMEKTIGPGPEITLTKVDILTKMERFSEATQLLDSLQGSMFAMGSRDLITANRAKIQLGQGQWDTAINTSSQLLRPGTNPAAPKQVVFGYYNSPNTNNKLSYPDFLNACSTLVLSLASRYGANKNTNDNETQQAIYNAMYQFAAEKSDQRLMNIVIETDAARSKAIINPIKPKTPQIGVLTPADTPGANTPTNPNDPWLPGNRPGTNFPSNLPNPAQPGTPGSNSPNNNVPIDEAQASLILSNAGVHYANGDYKTVDTKLLDLLMSSETFFKDCPTVAPAAALMRANALFKMEDYRNALTACSYLLSEAPNSQAAVDANYYLGVYYDYVGNTDKAIESLEKVTNSKMEGTYTADSYYYLGMNEWDRGNQKTAEADFRKVIRSYRNNKYWGHSVWALAQMEYNNRNYEEAERLVNEALADRPDRSVVDWLLFLKGEIALRNRDYEKARIAFKMIVDQYPDSTKYSIAQNRLANIPKPTNVAPDNYQP